jgi:hypothetical protein
MTHAFSDLIGEVAQRAPDIFAAPPGPRPHTCSRCEYIADTARKAGEIVPPVAQVEHWVHEGKTYYAGLCVACSDWEWSVRWNRRFKQARDLETKQALERQKAIRCARGRRFYGTAGVP